MDTYQLWSKITEAQIDGKTSVSYYDHDEKITVLVPVQTSRTTDMMYWV